MKVGAGEGHVDPLLSQSHLKSHMIHVLYRGLNTVMWKFPPVNQARRPPQSTTPRSNLTLARLIFKVKLERVPATVRSLIPHLAGAERC